MKTILVSIFLLLVAFPALSAEPWTIEQKGLASAWILLLEADRRQTLDDSKPGIETNPIIGPDFPRARVNVYFATVAVSSLIALHFMPSEWRTRALYFGVGVQGHTVWLNWKTGWRF